MTANRVAIPGFTATAALAAASTRTTSHRTAPAATGNASASVVPQARALDRECYVNCLRWGGSRQSCFRGCSYELPV